MSTSIDLNCDMGEGIGCDEPIIPHVTSVNIACGFHAGNPATMRKTVRLAVEHGVAIGAYPGLPDLVSFGRREMPVTPQEVHDMVLYQAGALAAFARAAGATVTHLKPHGAPLQHGGQGCHHRPSNCRSDPRLRPRLHPRWPGRQRAHRAGESRRTDDRQRSVRRPDLSSRRLAHARTCCRTP